MNTNQLYDIMWHDLTVTSAISAVVSCKALKYISNPRGCYIINTSEQSHLPGDVGHWIFLRVHGSRAFGADCIGNRKKMRLEIFDVSPTVTYNQDIEQFINRFNSFHVNHVNISNNRCGFYALVYCYYRCRGFSPNCILNILLSVRDIEKHCLVLYEVGKKES